ncbi:hypothetical protein CTI12_AA007120 [Artemisia annua]|uniref:Uncharacterized protein n=1 Tax=Artemisia annua TaxID=35608 RepID=A0A2U1QHK0_ARTAN|nr:hypothetical protein CTI12_AA007120 [Artemisia annua]
MGTLPQAKHLPVIDLRLENLNPTSSTLVTTCGEVMRALEEYGCFIAMEIVLEYSKAVAELEHVVMRIIAKSYGIEESYESLLGSKTCLLRLTKYLIPQVKENKTIIGIYAHTDKTFTSILDK